MRRVYDDKHLDEAMEKVIPLFEFVKKNPSLFSEYDIGHRSMVVGKIRDYIFDNLDYNGFPCFAGKTEHAYGIGNNNAIEIIYAGEEEQQICGLLHLTDDMFGGVSAWVSDIDKTRKTPTYKFIDRSF